MVAVLDDLEAVAIELRIKQPATPQLLRRRTAQEDARVPKTAHICG